uniref:Lipid-binding serum glycoprotein C-terminal domain-containing protein n=1 Tax=Ditylenchus dipsaci TaxID=166011 RepID=A0A915D4P1_9BILA
MIENVINRDMNTILATMPLKVRINENNLDFIGQTLEFRMLNLLLPSTLLKLHFLKHPKPSSRSKQANKPVSPLPPAKNLTLLNFVHQLRDQNLVLDFSLINDPFVSQGTILMKSHGEISFSGFGGTPFYPPNVVIPAPHGVHMAEFFGTDYIANSMLYHAYRQHYMDVTVGPESSPQLKDVLQTSCPSGFCIGEFLVYVRANPKNATQVKAQVIRAETTMTSNVNLWIDRTHIVGNASIENLDFKLLEASIKDVDQSTFGDLGLFVLNF